MIDSDSFIQQYVIWCILYRFFKFFFKKTAISIGLQIRILYIYILVYIFMIYMLLVLHNTVTCCGMW